jgi:hypothetical protein
VSRGISGRYRTGAGRSTSNAMTAELTTTDAQQTLPRETDQAGVA